MMYGIMVCMSHHTFIKLADSKANQVNVCIVDYGSKAGAGSAALRRCNCLHVARLGNAELPVLSNVLSLDSRLVDCAAQGGTY